MSKDDIQTAINEGVDAANGPLGASFSNVRQLEELLLEGIDSGEAAPMTSKRWKKIYAAVKKR